MKFILDYNKRRVLINLQEESISITIEPSRKGSNAVIHTYNLDELASYQVQFPTQRFTSIIFNTKSKKSQEYSFIRKKETKEQISVTDLMESFISIIKKHNKKDGSNKIVLLPSFHASKYGLWTLIGLVILFLFAIVLGFIYNVKTVPVSLFSAFALIVQIAVRRNSDATFYKKNKN